VAAESYVETAAGWANIAPSLALEATWKLIGAANAHLEANEPWKMEPGPELDAVMGDALEVLRLVAILATPAMPAICEQVWARIGLPGVPGDQRLPDAAAWGGYPGGLPVEKGDPLFPRMAVPKAD
jgi:methionyl-tRNA synthetase